MENNFNFKECEAKINKKWLDGNYFFADAKSKKPPFTIIMPPPNVTSKIHIGHAFENSIMDAVIRFKRMQGFEALLLPGADHAAIATEVKVVEELKKQGLTKQMLGRQAFMQKINDWYGKYGGEIKNQIMRIGVSCDWSKYVFTMDDSVKTAVNKVFLDFYNKGLIYKGDRITNWCPVCKTALSDAEVIHSDKNSTMFYIKYPIEKGLGFLEIATTRPETMFGDVAVAVNPQDPRYKQFIGKNVTLPFINKLIPIVADNHADPKFGSGVVKITPAHDANDYEVAKRHNLPLVKIMNDDATLNSLCGKNFEGLDRYIARKKVLEELKKLGLFVKEKAHKNSIGACERCHTVVEPTSTSQWFVKMKELAKPAIKAVESGELKIIPSKFKKVYLHWLNNINDWCISRQLWSGHKIPLDGEEDVLDTWFSSALWPFCTLGWPDKTANAEFQKFYPTNLMTMGYDILFFWGIRMVFSGIEHTGKLPFNELLFHGLVRDSKGIKMSKSLGNGIDPVDIIEKYGVDVMRFSLLYGTKTDRDPRYGWEKCDKARNFVNKIWNATKFVVKCHSERSEESQTDPQLSDIDKWALSKLNATIKRITTLYNKYDFGIAANVLQDFFWGVYCDWYIELSKKHNATMLKYILEQFLKLAHPLMPFVTEEIWCNVLGHSGSIMTEPFPVYDAKQNYKKQAELVESTIIEKIKAERVAKLAPKIDVKAEIEKLKFEIKRSEGLLKNAGFVAKAPKALLDAEKAKLEKNRAALKDLEK